MDATGKPPKATETRPLPCSAGQWPGANVDSAGRLVRDIDTRGIEHETRWIPDDRDLLARQQLEEIVHGCGDRPPQDAVQDEDGERRQPVEGGTLSSLGRQEVAALLARERRDNDPAHAHRPRPGQGLRVDPRPDDEDGPGRADVERARQELAIGTGGNLQPAAGGTTQRERAAQTRPLGSDADTDSRLDLANDPGDRRLERLLVLTGRDAPATVGLEEQLPFRLLIGMAARRDTDTRPALARSEGGGVVSLEQARLPQPIGNRLAGEDRLTAGDDRTVTGRQRQPRIDRSIDEGSSHDEVQSRRRRGRR